MGAESLLGADSFTKVAMKILFLDRGGKPGGAEL
jgi:hypothetical protein